MKKLVLILMVGFICTTMIAQTSDGVPKEELAATQIIDQVFDRTTEAIQQISEALKVPAEHVYSVLVRQQTVKSITGIIAIVMIFILSGLAIYIPLRNYNNKNAEYNIANKREPDYQRYDLDDDWWLFSIVPGIIIISITLIVLSCSLGTIVTGIINPEYGAIKDILSIL